MGNIPILGQTTPAPDRFDKKFGAVHNRDGVARGDIHDSEIAEIGQLLEFFGQRAGQRRDYDAFQREIEERFHTIGWAVDVSWNEFALDGAKIEGALSPMIEIVGRVDRTTFDHDQKVHEVTRDILDLKEGGIIKSDLPIGAPEAHKH